MPEITEYKPGTPTWVDLGTSDVAAAANFYSNLFGWEAQDLGPDAGHYTMFTLRGKYVAAVGPLQNPQQPVAWSTYLATDDADATARKVKEAGGTVLMEPFDVFTSGRMGVFLDPTGAAVLAWQPRDHKGAQLGNEPNTWGWSELHTRNVEKARAFYKAAFGLDSEPFEGMDYFVFSVDGRGVGGLMSMEDMPQDVPPHWLTYFGVEDTDAAVKQVGELGGSTMVPPTDIPNVGRFAVVSDPQGGTFAVIKSVPPPSS
jgi:uncharacterized protein